ncbi:hypothetical protein CG740_38165 [Streptomyces sp. CB01201]|uniref:hypothetical protein n=1 Tax=Streptomyces sp. CB01201 TaxID=2020324 RepID=UPI000C272368|nr:hypothetical protein [Streptomyces sp. CB01201]PJM98001.1 hypothetical protein CG740_38165 [Streptomyces sp. CB01201]
MQTPEPAVCDDQVVAGPGGAMTDEVGVITGDLTIRTTRQADHHVVVTIQYTGADEWYTLTGSPVAVPDGQIEDYHHRVLDAVEAGAQAVAPQ